MRWHRGPLRILIVSATVGAGDVGNARELARRLEAGGHHVTVRDFLDAPPLGIGRALTKGYEAELRHAPWAYEAAFRVWFWMPFLLVPLSRFVSFFTRKRVSAWARETGADIVVSTYPVSTQVLGDMRRRALSRRPFRRWPRRHRLDVPAVNVVTDFGYHPFWAHPGIDLNLAVHPATAAAVGRRTGRPSAFCEPLVSPAFCQWRAQARRAPKRTELGLAPDEVAVLITSGSWGVGDVAETFELVARRPGLVPVVACGHNAKLQEDLEALAEAKGYRGLAVGWTADMASLMATCDVLVENAGGLSCLEAMAAGLPLVGYRPIPGHGRNSAAVMAEAGVSHWATTDEQLVDQLEALGRPPPARQRQLQIVAGLFSNDTAEAVTATARSGALPRPQLRPVARLVRAASTLALASALGWFGLTTGVGVAAAAGVGVAHPPSGAISTVFVGVRLSPQELADGQVRRQLARLHITAVVSTEVGKLEPRALRQLVALGANVDSGGLGLQPGTDGAPASPWAEAISDTRSAEVLAGLTGRPVTSVVPDRSVSAFDLMDASSAHIMMVVPDQLLPISPNGPYPRDVLALPPFQQSHIYLVDGLQLEPSQLLVLLANASSDLSEQHLAVASFSELQ